MIRRLLARLVPGTHRSRAAHLRSRPLIRSAASQISRGAQDVMRKLQQAGFKAFVVGGAVRDLLLGITPKDFDLATNATPEQVKPLFRRAFIIGRRFRLVHVLAGAETIEVSTFRSRQTGDDTADEHGRLLSDNVFGTQAAGRRPARLHHQRAVFRSDDRGGLGLRRRRGRHQGAAAAPDRRSGDALSRRPGAHAARSAAGREARDRASKRRPRRRSPSWRR